ncbi:MAG: Nif3-like dinuclear metal center hexameric protein [Eubacteriales bacterium]|nr:Nif3-like dinuclear metal center hexameric protein [Eubacteriales bacterium]
MHRNEWENFVENLCSLSLQESWDNSGWQIFLPDKENDRKNRSFRRILTALEINRDVIEEAKQLQVDLIVTHHPLIFGKLSSVDYSLTAGEYVIRLIQSGISVYSCHTCFDAADGGNNDILGEILGFQEIRKISSDNPYLRRGEWPVGITLEEAARLLGERLDMNPEEFHIVGDRKKSVKSACWCTGSGSEFIHDAEHISVDLYITGDVKYHDAQEALATGLSVIDAGHYGTEKIFSNAMAEKIRQYDWNDKNRPEVFVSSVAMDPFSC